MTCIIPLVLVIGEKIVFFSRQSCKALLIEVNQNLGLSYFSLFEVNILIIYPLDTKHKWNAYVDVQDDFRMSNVTSIYILRPGSKKQLIDLQLHYPDPRCWEHLNIKSNLLLRQRHWNYCSLSPSLLNFLRWKVNFFRQHSKHRWKCFKWKWF